MGGNLETMDRAAVESLIDWWSLAGVDAAVGDAPRAWLGGKQPTDQSRFAKPAAPVDATEAPVDLGSFHQWLGEAKGLPLDRPGAVRHLPRGQVGAAVMVMSDLPDKDEESAQLLVRMLAAIGVDSDAAYHASLACFHSPGARIGRDELAQCAAIARDHIRFARPQRLILFGDAPARALLDEPLARARGKLHKVEGVRTIATFHPRWLLQRPSDKALAWRDLLLLMSEGE